MVHCHHEHPANFCQVIACEPPAGRSTLAIECRRGRVGSAPTVTYLIDVNFNDLVVRGLAPAFDVRRSRFTRWPWRHSRRPPPSDLHHGRSRERHHPPASCSICRSPAYAAGHLKFWTGCCAAKPLTPRSTTFARRSALRLRLHALPRCSATPYVASCARTAGAVTYRAYRVT